MTDGLAQRVNDFQIGEFHNTREQARENYKFSVEEANMEFNPPKNLGLEQLVSGIDSSFTYDSNADSLAALANFSNTHTGSGYIVCIMSLLRYL
ncbi:hypothetical protein [Myxosarcina sp. GI1(2024)]